MYPSSEENEERQVTVEAAALFMISAIYHGKLDFGRVPILRDISVPPIERTTKNSPERIELGYRSAMEWYESCRIDGLEALREQGRHPLASAKLTWSA